MTTVRPAGPGDVPALAALLVRTVEDGASIGFMAPLSAERAAAFWTGVLAEMAGGRRAVLVAVDAGGVVGSVQVAVDLPANQPHRGDLQKMMVDPGWRRRGIGAALLRAAEAAAADAGRTLLVLDTASPEAERLYQRDGWQRVGVIPDYALLPAGGLVATTIFYKYVGRPEDGGLDR